LTFFLLFRVKEIATKGYFHDLTMTKKHGGKTWIAPKVLIREDVRFFTLTGYAMLMDNPGQ